MADARKHATAYPAADALPIVPTPTRCRTCSQALPIVPTHADAGAAYPAAYPAADALPILSTAAHAHAVPCRRSCERARRADPADAGAVCERGRRRAQALAVCRRRAARMRLYAVRLKRRFCCISTTLCRFTCENMRYAKHFICVGFVFSCLTSSDRRPGRRRVFSQLDAPPSRSYRTPPRPSPRSPRPSPSPRF